MPPLTQQDLDHAQCGTPGCTEKHGVLFLHAGCHMRAGTTVSYHPATGTLLIECKQCGKKIAEIAVAYDDEFNKARKN